MDDASIANRERKTTIAARVPRDLAAALAELADQGNRSVSREVCGALAEHVRNAGVSSPRSERPQTTPDARRAEQAVQAQQASSAQRTGQGR